MQQFSSVLVGDKHSTVQTVYKSSSFIKLKVCVCVLMLLARPNVQYSLSLFLMLNWAKINDIN